MKAAAPIKRRQTGCCAYCLLRTSMCLTELCIAALAPTNARDFYVAFYVAQCQTLATPGQLTAGTKNARCRTRTARGHAKLGMVLALVLAVSFLSPARPRRDSVQTKVWAAIAF